LGVAGGGDWLIPCYINNGLADADAEHSDAEISVYQLAGNVQEQLPPSRVAERLREVVLDQYWTPLNAGRALGMTPRQVQVMLWLAEATPAIRARVDRGDLSLSAFAALRTAPEEMRTEEEAREDGDRTTVDSVRRATRAERLRERARQRRLTADSAEPDIVIELAAHALQTAQLLSQVVREERRINDDTIQLLRSLCSVLIAGNHYNRHTLLREAQSMGYIAQPRREATTDGGNEDGGAQIEGTQPAMDYYDEERPF
jgi:hypothetical protein